MPTLAAGTVSALWASAGLPALRQRCRPDPDQIWLLLAGFGLINSTSALRLFLYGSTPASPRSKPPCWRRWKRPIAPLWVWLVFGETPASPTLLGGTVVFVGGVLVHLRDSHRA